MADTSDDMKTETTIKLIRDLGFPIFTSVALGWVVWVLGSSMMVQHNRFIDSVAESVRAQSQAMGLVQQSIARQVELTDTMQKTVMAENIQTREMIANSQHNFVEAAKQMQRLTEAIENRNKKDITRE